MRQRLWMITLLAVLLLSFSAYNPARADDPPVAKPPVYKVSLTSFAGTVPANVANEVKFGFEQPQQPFVDTTSAGPSRYYWAGVPQDPNLPLRSEIAACGFQDQPQAQLVAPDGSTENVTLEFINGTNNDCWTYVMKWSSGMLLGDYELRLADSAPTTDHKNVLSYKWNVNYPTQKMVARLEDGSYLLMGFPKSNNITIRFYALQHDESGNTITDPNDGTPIAAYVTTGTIKADDLGAALLQMSVPPSAPFTLDEVRFVIDGAKATTWDSPDVFAALSGKKTCPESPPQQLQAFQNGRVLPDVQTSDDYTAVRISPKNGTIIDHLNPGDTFTVLAGPVCAPNWSWWKIQSGSLVGWMVEGKGNQYWLEPQ